MLGTWCKTIDAPGEPKECLRPKYSEVTAKNPVNQTLDFYMVLVI